MSSSYSSSIRVGVKVRHQTGGHKGIIRFVGEIPELLTPSQKQKNEKLFWAGVEWKEPKGKNDGSVPSSSSSSEKEIQKSDRHYYFHNCLPNHGSFVRLILSQQNQSKDDDDEVDRTSNSFFFTSNSLLPEQSLVQVLTERFSLPVGADLNRLAPNSPFVRDPNRDNAFVNCFQVDCHASIDLQIVATAGGDQLSKYFPNLKTVSVSGVLLTSWKEALSIAFLLPKIESLNISDNDFGDDNNNNIEKEDEIEALSSSGVSSKSLLSFNCSNVTGFKPKYFWFLFELFPSMQELFLCHLSNRHQNNVNDFQEIPPPTSSASHTSIFNLEHLVLAHNNFKSFDSIIRAFTSSSSSSCVLESKLHTINLSSNPNLEKVTIDVENDKSFWKTFPNLSNIIIRDTGFRTFKDLLQLFPNGEGGSPPVSDISLSGIRLLHPEKEMGENNNIIDPIIKILFFDDNNRFNDIFQQQQQQQLPSNNNNNNNNLSNFNEAEKNLLHGENSDRRKILMALLPSSILRINNTSIEKTNWFGSTVVVINKRRQSSSSSIGPVRQESIRWLVDKILSSSFYKKNPRDISFLEFLSSSFEEFRQEFKQEFMISTTSSSKNNDDDDKEVENENKQDHHHHQSQQHLQQIFNLKVLTLFPSSPSYQEVFSNENYLLSYFTPFIQHFLSSSSSSSKNLRDENLFVEVDVRWTVQELEEKIVKDFMKLSSMMMEPCKSNLYASPENWAVLDLALKNWRGFGFTAPHRQVCESQWKWIFPPGKSVALFLVDGELFENETARKRGLFLTPLWRTQAQLFSFGRMMSEKDIILVLVN